MNTILASKSPRRAAILDKLGFQYEIIVSTCDEVINKSKPEDIVLSLSKQKAINVADSLNKKALIIAADTIVYKDGEILGKPKDETHAFQMLSSLQGNWHSVYTGVCIIKEDGSVINYYEKSDVHMSAQSDEDIWNYINNANVLDKAGAYGIQDSKCNFVDKVKGEIETVIGLPVIRLKKELK